MQHWWRQSQRKVEAQVAAQIATHAWLRRGLLSWLETSQLAADAGNMRGASSCHGRVLLAQALRKLGRHCMRAEAASWAWQQAVQLQQLNVLRVWKSKTISQSWGQQRINAWQLQQALQQWFTVSCLQTEGTLAAAIAQNAYRQRCAQHWAVCRVPLIRVSPGARALACLL